MLEQIGAQTNESQWLLRQSKQFSKLLQLLIACLQITTPTILCSI